MPHARTALRIVFHPLPSTPTNHNEPLHTPWTPMYRGMQLVPLYISRLRLLMSPLQWDSLILANFHFCRRCDLFLFFFRCRPATRPQTLPKHTRGPVRRPFCRRIFLAPRQSFKDLFCMVTSNFKNMSRVRPSIRRTPPNDVISSGLPVNFLTTQPAGRLRYVLYSNAVVLCR